MNMKTKDTDSVGAMIRNSRFVTVLHYYATGPGQELHQWLVGEHAAITTLIEHPFPFSSRSFTRVESCEDDCTPVEMKVRRRNMPLFIRYFFDFFRTIRIIRSQNVKYDWYIGNGFFDTLSGIALRRMGKVKHVILYTIDYAPGSPGSLYHALYCALDRWCCRKADAIWNLSNRMQPARFSAGLHPPTSAPVVWVPHGTRAVELAPHLSSVPSVYRAVFMGHVQEKSGIQLFLDIMPSLRRLYPDLHLDVIGGGPYLETLKSMAVDRGVADVVTFHGFIDDHRDLEQRLMQCAVGVALYNPDDAGFSSLADPGKPKVYLACGLPVIITGVPEVADEIDQTGAGKLIGYRAEELLQAMKDIVEQYPEYRKNALEMGRKYDWNNVFVRAWGETAANR